MLKVASRHRIEMTRDGLHALLGAMGFLGPAEHITNVHMDFDRMTIVVWTERPGEEFEGATASTTQRYSTERVKEHLQFLVGDIDAKPA